MSVLLGRCYALREQLDAIIDELERADKPAPTGVCEHPEEKRKYEPGTMGSGAGFACGECGEKVAAVSDITGRLIRPTPGA